jgi:hypothetical protein
MNATEQPENIYTLLPRFVTNTEEGNYHGEKYLPAIIRDFEWKNLKFTFVISPARLTDENGEDRFYYVGEREKLIEEALRKLAVEDNINFRSEEFTLDFSLNQLIDEIIGITGDLKHNRCEIKTRIKILADIKYELIKDDSELYFRPIERLIITERDEEIYYRAQFSQLFFTRTEQFDFCFLKKGGNEITHKNGN